MKSHQCCCNKFVVYLNVLFSVINDKENFSPRLFFYKDNMYYFASDAVNAKRITWIEANSTCTGLFKLQNGWPGRSGNLASFQTKEEFDFIR